ncbi:ATP-binding cassette domain-containing protein [Streptomyces hydrogenans]|uniref:ABC transporter ATP-binding protein n=1 Tax=Streptomyces hydrogenans TaxID=1873719 RepID=A0ABQ3PQD2_9ACTN|nr:ATP-binding cassette domain-containing protein [Streptomyces hydrogenans]GHE25478.1 ABC transporter ATP-binding protein [Streptomyces hydrogenans]GHI27237.1 ABC transporter ATP-binding protein [Streptomyces hydrogenans]
MPRTPLGLEARNLVQGYHGRPVLDGLTLEAGGGVLGLLGPNGAGKTTLLKTLATTLPPRSGDLRILGRDISDRQALRAVRRRLGYLPQEFGYFPSFTVYDFVRYCAWLREVPTSDIHAAVTTAIERVRLTDVRHRKLKHLSGGMLQRCGIAQAIVADPDLIIFDEPTVGLDPQQRLEFRDLLRDIGQRAAVIFSTHLIEDIAAAADTVVVLTAGTVLYTGTPDELSQLAAPCSRGDTAIERGYMELLTRGLTC